MSYVIQAVLSSSRHPEYGQVTVSFPIPREEYDTTVERLEAMEMGDTVERDCQIDSLNSHYSILKELERSVVTLDELDYQAKRLDSFCVGEDAQFRAMACKLGLPCLPVPPASCTTWAASFRSSPRRQRTAPLLWTASCGGRSGRRRSPWAIGRTTTGSRSSSSSGSATTIGWLP